MSTLALLRRRCADACEKARKVSNGLNSKPRFLGQNMRQAWEENAKWLEPFLLADDTIEDSTSIKVVPTALLEFHYAGELYYHAKKYGLQSAMLMRLKRI